MRSGGSSVSYFTLRTPLTKAEGRIEGQANHLCLYLRLSIGGIRLARELGP